MRPSLDRDTRFTRVRGRPLQHRAHELHSLAEILHPDGPSIPATR
jgi:hypothetical protein